MENIARYKKTQVHLTLQHLLSQPFERKTAFANNRNIMRQLSPDDILTQKMQSVLTKEIPLEANVLNIKSNHSRKSPTKILLQ